MQKIFWFLHLPEVSECSLTIRFHFVLKKISPITKMEKVDVPTRARTHDPIWSEYIALPLDYQNLSCRRTLSWYDYSFFLWKYKKETKKRQLIFCPNPDSNPWLYRVTVCSLTTRLSESDPPMSFCHIWELLDIYTLCSAGSQKYFLIWLFLSYQISWYDYSFFLSQYKKQTKIKTIYFLRRPGLEPVTLSGHSM